MVFTVLALLLSATEVPRVIVSRHSATVIFPRDTSTSWGWPAKRPQDIRHGFAWSISGLGVGDTYSIVLQVGRGDPLPRTFVSLSALVTAGTVERCTPGMISRCTPTSWLASVEDGRVVLRVADSAGVDSAFGMHPPNATVWRLGPQESDESLMESARIEYTEPVLPMPDGVRIAAALRAARDYQASITRVTHYIGSGGDYWRPLWMAVGDTEEVFLGEMTCQYDSCQAGQVNGGTFRLADSHIAKLLPPRATRDRDMLLSATSHRVLAVTPGATTLIVNDVGSSSRGVVAQTPPASRVERALVVTPRLARISIVPRLVRINSTRFVTISVNASDRNGGVHENVPATIVVINAGDTTQYGDSKVTRHFFPGKATIVARFRLLADTLRFTVVPPSRAPAKPEER